MTGDLWTPPDVGPDVLSALSEEERYRRFDALQARMPEVWESMRLNHDDESVVVIPSITLDRAAASSGSMTQAMEERFLFLLMLLRQPRLRMVYVTSMPIAPEIIEYYLALLPGVIPSHARARLSLVAVHDSSPRSLSEKLLDRPRLLARIAALVPNRGPLPPDPVQHHGARARRRSLAGHPDVRRRPAARTARLEDRVPSDVRRRRRAVPPRGGGPADARRAGRRRRLHARPAADHGQRHREAQRGRVRVRQRRRTPLRAPRARRPRRALAGDAADPGDGAGVSQADVRRLRRQVRRGRGDRGGTHHRDRAGEPQRPAAGAPRRQGRAALDPRPAAGRGQRAELPGVRVPGGTRVRPAHHPRRRADRAAPGARRGAGQVRGRLRRGAGRRRRVGGVRDRAEPPQGRHDPPVPDPAVPDRRPLRPRDGALPHPARPREAPGGHRPSRVRRTCGG